MRLVDSCGWIEVFTDGPAAGRYAELLERPEELIVPSIVLYEVYKALARAASEETALRCAAFMQQARLVALEASLAMESAETALRHGLAMADAIVYATALRHGAELVTSDADLEGLPGVRFIAG